MKHHKDNRKKTNYYNECIKLLLIISGFHLVLFINYHPVNGGSMTISTNKGGRFLLNVCYDSTKINFIRKKKTVGFNLINATRLN